MFSSADSVALVRLVVSSRELVFFEGEGHVRDLGSAGDLSRLRSSERKQRCSFWVASSAACAYIDQQCVALVSASFAFISIPLLPVVSSLSASAFVHCISRL